MCLFDFDNTNVEPESLVSKQCWWKILQRNGLRVFVEGEIVGNLDTRCSILDASDKTPTRISTTTLRHCGFAPACRLRQG
jgi:beta-phosphoglucomutase-like phosphatase (HAD superfamily)